MSLGVEKSSELASKLEVKIQREPQTAERKPEQLQSVSSSPLASISAKVHESLKWDI